MTKDDSNKTSREPRKAPLTPGRLLRSLFAITFFVTMMYLFVIPYTWAYFTFGKTSEERRLRYRRWLQGLSRYVIYRVPGVKFRLDNSIGELFDTPSIVISNHQSHLDLMCLMMLTPRLVFLTNDWVWHNPFYGYVIRRAEFVPVSDGIEANMAKLRDLYGRGYSIAVFPEGTRSRDGKVGRFHKGAFYLSRELGAPVLPIYLHGCYDVLPRHDFMLRRGRIDVVVGERVARAAMQGDLGAVTRERRHRFIDEFEQQEQKLRQCQSDV